MKKAFKRRTRSLQKLSLIVLVILVVPLILFYIFKDFLLENTPNDRVILEQIVVADASQPVFALLYVAEKKGYFEQEGLDIVYKKFTSGRDALTSVVEGMADLATVYETPVVFRAYEGHDIRIISGLHRSAENTAIVARKDKGVNVPADLKGKTVAVTKGSNGEFFLSSFLVEYSIARNDVQFIDTAPQDMVSSIQHGTVDVVATWNPHLFNARRVFSQDDIVTFFSDSYEELSVVAGLSSYIEGNPDLLRRFTRALVKAEIFLRENNRDAQVIVSEWLQDQSGTTIRATWEDAEHVLDLDDLLLDTLEKEGHWLREQGLVTGGPPDFEKVIFMKYLSEEKYGVSDL